MPHVQCILYNYNCYFLKIKPELYIVQSTYYIKKTKK